MEDSSPVLVTGASGFIATHIIRQLLESGHHVRGSLMDISATEKVVSLQQLCVGASHRLKLVQADLYTAADWKLTVAGCTYIIHLASPNPDSEDYEMGCEHPAVTGTLNFLRGCRAAGGVKRIVLTSCLSAIADSTTSGEFTENHWADNGMSKENVKAMVERVAWKYVYTLPESERFELVVLNPAFVVGPYHGTHKTKTMDVIRGLLERELPFIPKLNIPVMDVRDVASAHINALTIPEAAGHRHILVARNIWHQEIAEICLKEFDKYGYNVPTFTAPQVVYKAMSFSNKSLEPVVSAWDKELKVTNVRTLSNLGVAPRCIKSSIIDMTHSMIRAGFIKVTPHYRAHALQTFRL